MTDSPALKRTPLYDLHVSLGGKMVPFAGWEMPVQYPMGVMGEHLHTRAKAGLFDVSHMGQVILRAPSGMAADAAVALETLVPANIVGLPEMRQRYGLFTAPNGGVLVIVVRIVGAHLRGFVNGPEQHRGQGIGIFDERLVEHALAHEQRQRAPRQPPEPPVDRGLE